MDGVRILIIGRLDTHPPPDAHCFYDTLACEEPTNNDTLPNAQPQAEAAALPGTGT